MKRKVVLLILVIINSFAFSQTEIIGKSGTVSINIKKKKLPPLLTVSDIKFVDANGNDRIDAMEDCSIQFKISNTGKGPAMNMLMNVVNQSDVKGLTFTSSTKLVTINTGSQQVISVPIKGAMDLTTGKAVIKISFDEPLGFPPDEIVMNINTKSFEAPDVKMVDYQFVTDNGIIKLGFPVVLKTYIQNVGQGTAENVNVKFVYPAQNVIANSDEQFNIGTLAPNESRELVFDFSPSKKYIDAKIPIKVQINEKYGKFAVNSEVTATVDAKAQGSVITINSNYEDKKVEIQQVAFTSDVDRNIPGPFPKNNHRYALVIGNEDYATYQPGLNTESNVPFAVADARKFAEYAEITLGVPKENITVIENAKSYQMTKSIESLRKIIQYENGQAEVCFYYAGHGFPDDTTKESYIMPVDISGADVTHGVKLKGFYADLTKFPAKRVVVFLDACFSGGGRNAGLLAARSVKIKPKENEIKGNIIVLSAGTGEQSALPYKDKQHGMFTYFLLKTIQEKKGNLTYKELFDELKSDVELNSIKINGKDQNPELNYSKDVESLWESWKLN